MRMCNECECGNGYECLTKIELRNWFECVTNMKLDADQLECVTNVNVEMVMNV